MQFADVIYQLSLSRLKMITVCADAEVDFAARLERILNMLLLAPLAIRLRVEYDLLRTKTDAAVQRYVGRILAVPISGQIDDEPIV